ncbi:MAG: PP2C family protein-serine/threonine phosphatase [Sphingobacteriaceae bacterium]
MILNKRKYFSDSIVGLNKTQNQDNFFVIEKIDYSLYFVFDGLGSAKNSKLATELIIKFISKNYASYFKNGKYDFSGLMYSANKFLIEQNISETKTTYCSVCISNLNPEHIEVSNMGDSRVYIVNPQYVEQVTKDDRFMSSKNIITKCLGMSDLDQEDFTQNIVTISSKDKILLCTDGFYNLMESDKITYFQTIQMRSNSVIKKKLHELIKGRNIDDSTFIFIR